MKRIFISSVLMLMLVSCCAIPDTDSIVVELNNKHQRIKYAVYSYSIFSLDSETYRAIIFEKQGRKNLFLQTKTIAKHGVITNEWLYTPTYGLNLTKFDGKLQGEIAEQTGERYNILYRMETIPTEMIKYAQREGATITLLGTKFISGFDTYTVEIINDTKYSNKESHKIILNYDKNTGFLVSEEKYDLNGRLTFSYKLNTLDRASPNAILQSVDFSNVDVVKKLLKTKNFNQLIRFP